MLDGALREVRFSWPEESADSTSSSAAGGGGGDIREMQPIGEAVLETNEVCYINGNFLFKNLTKMHQISVCPSV